MHSCLSDTNAAGELKDFKIKVSNSSSSSGGRVRERRKQEEKQNHKNMRLNFIWQEDKQGTGEVGGATHLISPSCCQVLSTYKSACVSRLKQDRTFTTRITAAFQVVSKLACWTGVLVCMLDRCPSLCVGQMSRSLCWTDVPVSVLDICPSLYVGQMSWSLCWTDVSVSVLDICPCLCSDENDAVPAALLLLTWCRQDISVQKTDVH